MTATPSMAPAASGAGYRTRRPGDSDWLLRLLAVIVPVLAIAFGAAGASAATTGVAETPVRASAAVVAVPVGPPEHIAAGQRLGEAGPRVVTAVATVLPKVTIGLGAGRREGTGRVG